MQSRFTPIPASHLQKSKVPTAILSTTAKAAERQRKKAAEKEKAAGGAAAAAPAAETSKPVEGEAGLCAAHGGVQVAAPATGAFVAPLSALASQPLQVADLASLPVLACPSPRPPPPTSSP